MDNLPQPEVIIKPSLPKIPLIIASVILLLILTTLILNYLNLLPFSKPKPKLTSKPAVSPPPKVLLLCPVPKEFCPKAQNIPSPNFYLGLSFKLPAGTALLAPFDGQFEMFPQADKDASSVSIRVKSAGEKYTAIYFIAGDNNTKQAENSKPRPVKAGEKIATVSAKPAPYRFRENQSLIYYVYKGKQDLPANRVALKPEDLLKEVDPDTR